MVESSGDDPSISIILPVMNAAGTIKDSLDSLMKLDYDKDKLEIIVVDGNSTDGTRKIVEEYPVTLVEEEGRGLNAARNTGIRWSTGEIIAFTDGDCVVPPDWARSIVKNFRDPFVGFVGGLVEGYNKEDFLSKYMDETFFHAKPYFRERKETTDLNLLQFPAGCNMAFRRHALEKIDFFDERIYYGFDDLDPVEQLGSKGFRIVLDPDVFVWHQHRTSLKALLKQHFKYGRGGALLIIYKRASRLARWFTTYLFSTTLAISLLITMVAAGLILNFMFLIQFITASGVAAFMLVMSFYLKTAVRTRSLRKLILYPILDFARGFSFTFGGITQLFKMIIGENESFNEDKG
jgi:cellulose synthase/poly-beta-1,6-N-acetylglucosamine synthase-like glycosyltransferase